MPTSITVVATSTSAPPVGERGHRRLLLARPQLAVQQHDAEVARARSRASRSYSAVAARAWSASDSSTSGQTTNAWRPRAQLLADALVGARALALARGDVRRRSAGGPPAARAAR